MKDQSSLGFVIRYFKGKCTYLIRKKINKKFERQNRYHDRIILTNQEFYNIKQYIINNPQNLKMKH